MQKNLEQIRALHALRFWDETWPDPAKGKARLERIRGADGGNVVEKLGPLILECGLLATLSLAKQREGGYQTLMSEIGKYLSSQGADGRHLLPDPAPNLDAFIQQLTQNDSKLLRRATAEALLYAGYLKRFAPPKGKPALKSDKLGNPVLGEGRHAD